MRAIVFSNFPKDVFENSLKPKFDQNGVEILKVVRIDRSSNIDVSKADVLISMVELMSVGQRNKIKALAKTTGKRYIGLLRGGSDWTKELASNETAVQALPRAINGPVLVPRPLQQAVRSIPTLVQPPEPPESEPETKEEDDEEAFTAMQELLDEASAHVQRLLEEKAELVKQLQAQSRIAITLNSEMTRVSKTLSDSKQQSEELTKESRTLREENKLLKDQVVKISSDLSAARAAYNLQVKETEAAKAKPTVTVGALDNLFKSIDAMKILCRQGLMTADEAFEKLANFKPQK